MNYAEVYREQLTRFLIQEEPEHPINSERSLHLEKFYLQGLDIVADVLAYSPCNEWRDQLLIAVVSAFASGMMAGQGRDFLPYIAAVTNGTLDPKSEVPKVSDLLKSEAVGILASVEVAMLGYGQEIQAAARVVTFVVSGFFAAGYEVGKLRAMEQ